MTGAWPCVCSRLSLWGLCRPHHCPSMRGSHAGFPLLLCLAPGSWRVAVSEPHGCGPWEDSKIHCVSYMAHVWSVKNSYTSCGPLWKWTPCHCVLSPSLSRRGKPIAHCFPSQGSSHRCQSPIHPLTCNLKSTTPGASGKVSHVLSRSTG